MPREDADNSEESV